MYEYISGTLNGLTPAQAVLDCQGIGYLVKISLHTYSQLEGQKQVKLLLHHVVREDAQLFYGFYEESERQLFRLLISVNGVGSNTAQMMLSSLSPNEIEEAILGGAVGVLQGVKGIGLKTAQRVIVDLKDKVGKTKDDSFKMMFEQDQQVYQESESALISLGFNKKQVEKVLKAIIKINPEITVEDMIKAALRQL